MKLWSSFLRLICNSILKELGSHLWGKGKDGRREKIDSEGGRGRERWWKRERER